MINIVPYLYILTVVKYGGIFKKTLKTNHMENSVVNENNFMFGFVLVVGALFLICIYLFLDLVVRGVKKIVKFFDSVSIPQEEIIVGKLISCRKRKEVDVYYSTDSSGVIVNSYSVPIERCFIIVKKGAKRVVKILISESIYQTMSAKKGQIISLVCQKYKIDNDYNLVKT